MSNPVVGLRKAQEDAAKKEALMAAQDVAWRRGTALSHAIHLAHALTAHRRGAKIEDVIGAAKAIEDYLFSGLPLEGDGQ